MVSNMGIIEIIKKLENDELYGNKYHMSQDNILAISKVNIKRQHDDGIVESVGCIVRNSELIVIIYDIEKDFDSHAVLPNTEHYVKSMITDLNLDFMTTDVSIESKEIHVDDILTELEEKKNNE